MSFFTDSDNKKRQAAAQRQEAEQLRENTKALGPDEKIRRSHLFTSNIDKIVDEMFENLAKAVRKRHCNNEPTRGMYEVHDHTEHESDGGLVVPRDLEHLLQQKIVEEFEMDYIEVEVHAEKDTNGLKGHNLPFYRMLATVYLSRNVT